jgi:hypothetical protein
MEGRGAAIKACISKTCRDFVLIRAARRAGSHVRDCNRTVKMGVCFFGSVVWGK